MQLLIPGSVLQWIQAAVDLDPWLCWGGDKRMAQLIVTMSMKLMKAVHSLIKHEIYTPNFEKILRKASKASRS